MAGIKSVALCLAVVLCCGLLAGCSEKRSTDASAAELRKTASLLAQAERDRDSARMVLKTVRREAEKLKTNLDKAHSTMRGALDRLEPLEKELIQLKKELAKLKPPEKGAPSPKKTPK